MSWNPFRRPSSRSEKSDAEKSRTPELFNDPTEQAQLAKYGVRLGRRVALGPLAYIPPPSHRASKGPGRGKRAALAQALGEAVLDLFENDGADLVEIRTLRLPEHHDRFLHR